MSENFSVGIYKYATIPNSKTAKIWNAVNLQTTNSGISDINYAQPVEIPSYVYHNNIKYEIVEIGLSSFRNCTHVPKMIIPPTIITIKKWAFDWLISCTEFIFLPGSKLTTISSDSFCRCYSIKTLILPNSIRTIENYSISYMKSLKYVYICGNPSIETDIFKDYVKGYEVVAPDDLEIFVPFEFTGTLVYRTFKKSYFNKVCDFTIKCNSYPNSTLYLRYSSCFAILCISL